MKASFLSLLLLFFLIGCEAGSEGGSGAAASAGSDDQHFSAGGDFAGSHILVAYNGAMRADPSITRTKEEAEARARELIAQLQDDPEQFEVLAKEMSDGPSGPRGGSLGTWQKGAMVPEFDAAIEQMSVGDITGEPVETAFGYHVIRRDDTRSMHYGMKAFVLLYSGQGMPDTVTRTKEEAEALALELKDEVTAENFEAMANEHGDIPEDGLLFDVFSENDERPEEMKALVPTLEYDEVGGPVELPNGYAFVKRFRVEQRAGAHILVAYQGAERADPSITRTKEEAEARARELITELKDQPDQFSTYAQQHSDGPSGVQGGDLGVWFKGFMVPEFDNAIEGLDLNAISAEPVETPFGYHIIQRKPVDQ